MGEPTKQGDSNKDPLLVNKILGAILMAALLIFGVPQLTRALTGGGAHHGGGHGDELHLAYGGDIQLETGGGHGEEKPKASLAELLQNANASAGERRSALCKSCHTFEEGGANLTGPNLWDVVGRPVASHAGFNYSGALQALGGTWTYERLDAFIRNSQEFVPGTAMAQRVAKDEQRAELLAYMATLSSNPVPFPEPEVVAPAEVEEAAHEGAPEMEAATSPEAADADGHAASAEDLFGSQSSNEPRETPANEEEHGDGE